MKSKALIVLLPAAALLALALSSKSDATTLPPRPGPNPNPNPTPFPQPDGERPITVIGDSFGVGIAAALRAQGKRPLKVYAKVGAPSTAMKAAPDDGTDVIVSAGTNDVAGIPSAEGPARELALSNAVDHILRVLDVFAIGAPTRGGRLYYVLPHDKMGGTIGKNVDDLLKLLVGPLDIPVALEANPHFQFGSATKRAVPNAPDKIHFDNYGYNQIANDALAFFDS